MLSRIKIYIYDEMSFVNLLSWCNPKGRFWGGRAYIYICDFSYACVCIYTL